MKTIAKLCMNDSCSKKYSATPHKFLGNTKEEGFSATWEVFECTLCQNIRKEPKPDRVKKQRYPYLNLSTGVTFQDKDHEKKYVKENKLEALGSKERAMDIKY